MMITYLILLNILAIAYTLPYTPKLEHYLLNGYEQIDHKFGALHLKKETQEGTNNLIVWPKAGFGSEREHYEVYHRMQINRQSNPIDLSIAIEECVESSKPDYFKFTPTFISYVKPGVPAYQYSAPCFSENIITASIINNETITVTLTSENASSATCADAYLFATVSNFHFTLAFLHGKHTFTFAQLSPYQFNEIIDNGIAIFRFCDSLFNELPDVLMTLELFLGGLGLNPNMSIFGSKPPDWMIEANIKFIKDATGYQWEERPVVAQNLVFDLDPSLVCSGDIFAITRFDGLDQIIEYGAGSHAGHLVVASWIDDELYIFESQSAWYWPKKNIQMNPFKTWVEWANNAGFQVTWLPLKQEYRDRFDVNAAFDWFKTVNNTPYGYHNFIFGWIDTAHSSYPPILAVDLIAPVFAMIEYISPSAAQKVFTLALNKRLGTKNLTVTQISQVIYEKNMSWGELYAIVEEDSWIYPDGVSLVCSSFVSAFWKAGGLFGNITIQTTEFTPRDVYQLTLIDPSPRVPQGCNDLDPGNPYCQIMGKYRMQFPGISSVSLYDNMNEKCPSQPPEYFRPDGC